MGDPCHSVVSRTLRLRPLLDDPTAKEAVHIIRRDFTRHDGVGPRRVAEFITGTEDDAVQADVTGYLTTLLAALSRRAVEGSGAREKAKRTL